MQITPDRWRRIRTIFEAAIERPTEDRGAFLDDACSGDPELLRQVGSLIVASEGAGEAMADAIADAAVDAAETTRVGVPERVGRYRILDTLGEGGMGLVLLAERDDDSYHQEVAVKVIRQTLTSKDVVRRFENERQILADLDHTAIARLLDGGATGEGEPFLVMEYVVGRPIDVYSREEDLDTDGRLRLFVEVCDAVSHAHHRLVVHRDLKPSNILVTADGSPKLLDFGIAKLLDPERAGAGLTRTGMAALTPEYASPEQVLGEPITTASDVYSLGVLLYELLVGRSPYGDSIQTPAAILKAICEERPERPSDARRQAASETAETDVPQSKLGSDLDWILLMALRKEPERRYASVEELAQDLRAVLDGRPVMAHPDTWHYRSAKWFRRHWKLALAGVLVVAALGAGVVARTMEAQRAEKAAVEATQLAEFLRSLFEAADPYQSETMTGETTARDLVDRGAERVTTELADQPELQARMAEILGEIYLNLGAPEKAIDLLETAGEQRSKLPEDPEALHLNLLYRGRLAKDLGEIEPALELFRRSAEEAAKAHGPRSSLVAKARVESGITLVEARRYEEATRILTGVLAIQDELDEPDRAVTVLAHATLGRAARHRADVDEAERQMRLALKVLHELYGDAHPDIAAVLGQLGSIANMRGDHETAAELKSQGIEMNRGLLGDHPTVVLSLNNLGKSLLEGGKNREAAEAYREAIDLYDRLALSDPDLRAQSLSQLGQALAAQGDDTAAEAAMREAVLAAPYHVTALQALGDHLLKRQRASDAESFYRRALEVTLDGYPGWRVASARFRVGSSLVPQGRYDEAEEFLNDAYDGLEGDGAFYVSARRTVAERMAELYDAWGRPQQAEQARALLGAMED